MVAKKPNCMHVDTYVPLTVTLKEHFFNSLIYFNQTSRNLQSRESYQSLLILQM